MRIGSLADIRRRARPGLIPVGQSASLDSQVATLLSGVSSPKFWFDPSDAPSRFQDAAGSSLITASDQNFARINDKTGTISALSQSVTASMPLYQTDGNLHWARADGSNDSWKSLSSVNLSATDKLTLIFGIRKRSDAATGMLMEFSPSTSANDGSFGVRAPQGAAANFAFVARGTGAAGGSDAGRVTTNVYASPISAVVFLQYDLAQASTDLQITAEINGVAPSLSLLGLAAAGGGNFGNFFLHLFRRNDAILPTTADFFGMIGIGRLLTTTEKSLCVRYMAAKTGVNF